MPCGDRIMQLAYAILSILVFGRVAAARQHSHAFAGHLPSHFTQFVRTLVVDCCELLQRGGGAQLGHALKSLFA